MRTPGENFDQVSVVRQTYHANRPLSETVSKLVATGDGNSPVFRIRGTDELLLEEADFQRKVVDAQFRKAETYLELKANTPLFLEGNIKVRAKVRGDIVHALQLLMTPEDTPEYRSIRETLGFIEAGMQARTPGFHDGVLRMIITGDLPSRLELEERLRDLGGTAARQIYQVIPGGLLIKEVPRASRQLFESSEDESEAAEYPEPRAS